MEVVLISCLSEGSASAGNILLLLGAQRFNSGWLLFSAWKVAIAFFTRGSTPYIFIIQDGGWGQAWLLILALPFESVERFDEPLWGLFDSVAFFSGLLLYRKSINVPTSTWGSMWQLDFIVWNFVLFLNGFSISLWLPPIRGFLRIFDVRRCRIEARVLLDRGWIWGGTICGYEMISEISLWIVHFAKAARNVAVKAWLDECRLVYVSARRRLKHSIEFKKVRASWSRSAWWNLRNRNS